MIAIDRFLLYVKVTDSCWEWTGGCNNKGYGLFWVAPRKVLAHRFSYETFAGPIPDGLIMDHLCRVRNCVRPSHLEPVTYSVNALRGEAGWYSNWQRDLTHCKRGHEFTPENTIRFGDGHRTCRTCRNAAQRAAYVRHSTAIGRPKRRVASTTHGTTSCYHAGCRCRSCVVAHSAACLAYKQRKRAETVGDTSPFVDTPA